MIFLAFFCTGAFAAGQETSPAFTNKDLDQYRPQATAAEPPAREPGDHKAVKQQKTEAAANRKEQEYWCKKARQIKKSLTIAQDEVTEHTAHLNELSAAKTQAAGRKIANLEKQQNKAGRDLKAAGKRLKERQQTLAELEDDAYRNNVPPGWLRCQFE
ncbi:MAG: hypothetical protein C0402_07840 [Thermodesulfovibrio sp.]|nr:hypothetical protein [Thermodesulfovibrio sp.]